MEKDFDGKPITKDSRLPEYGETDEWRKKNPGTPVFAVRQAIIEAKKQAERDYEKKQRQAARRIPRGGNKFQGQDLSYGNFGNTKLTYAIMTDANLYHAYLAGANLSYAYLGNADLSNASLEFVDLTGANLTGADFRGANLENAQFGPDPSVPSLVPKAPMFNRQKVNLKGANFNSADLRNCWFVGVHAPGCDFRKAMLRRADFRGAALDRANFAYASLDGARGLNKVWKNGKLGSLKFIPDKKQPNTKMSKENAKTFGRESWGYDAQLSHWILDENDNPMLPDHDNAIKSANRVSKTPAYGLMAEDWEDRWSRNAAVIIDNSGSTSMKSGITHKDSGHEMTVLDRHIMTAAVYLANFPKQGNYMIITPSHSAVRRGVYDNFYAHIRYFDNTDDAIEHLFTIRPGGGGFSSRPDFKSEIDELMKRQNYTNVLLIMDEQIGHFL